MNYGGILGWVSLTFKRHTDYSVRQRAGLAKLETFRRVESIREENKTNAVREALPISANGAEGRIPRGPGCRWVLRRRAVVKAFTTVKEPYE